MLAVIPGLTFVLTFAMLSDLLSGGILISYKTAVNSCLMRD